MDWSATARGFGLGFSLIAAIGAQNAYVLTRGILRNHHWAIALVCSVIDALLITVGILGMGSLIQRWPSLITVLTIFGALFLLVYGLLSIRRMLQPGTLDTSKVTVSLGTAILTVVALSLLNPHVYLDTVILIGSVAVQEPEASRFDFGIGAVTASFVWFFCLAFGGQSLQRWFQKPSSWRVLDGFVAVVMLSLAWALAWPLIKSWI